MAVTSDVIVIGAGIAGASAAFEIAKFAKVVVLEMERQPGYHTTGRSAALFTELYGNKIVRTLTSAGREFFESPPEFFGEFPLTSPRGTLFIAREDQLASLGNAMPEESGASSGIRKLDEIEVRKLIPALRRDSVAAGVHEPDSRDIDVNAVHMGYLAGLRLRGGILSVNSQAVAIGRIKDVWRVDAGNERFEAPILVNASGAWCDAIAELAGVAPVGLTPKRRTAFVFEPPKNYDVDHWPAAIDIDEEFYFKPDAGMLLGSPADETPTAPCDAQPEEIDVATGIFRIENATDFSIRRPKRTWAGLRTFSKDKTPVVGMDPEEPGFFWLAAQGGFGIQTSPALARAAAGLICRNALPTDLEMRGLDKGSLAPDRFKSLPRSG